jgi:hypothetical protein
MSEQPKRPEFPYLDVVPACPRCGSTSVERDGPYPREPQMEEYSCTCLSCRLQWQDVYEVLPLFIGKEVEGELLQTTRQITEQAARYWAWELVQAARCALADLEGIMPEHEPSGDRTHPGWQTVAELRKILGEIGGLTGEPMPAAPADEQAPEGGDHDDP